MLTTLSTMKIRLALLESDTTFDSLLTSAIRAISSRFDKETNRVLARTENARYKFDSTGTVSTLPKSFSLLTDISSP